MKALVGAFNQEKALVGAFSVIVQPVVEPMEHYYTALNQGRGAAAAGPEAAHLHAGERAHEQGAALRPLPAGPQRQEVRAPATVQRNAGGCHRSLSVSFQNKNILE